jgi:hypothetical protein
VGETRREPHLRVVEVPCRVAVPATTTQSGDGKGTARCDHTYKHRRDDGRRRAVAIVPYFALCTSSYSLRSTVMCWHACALAQAGTESRMHVAVLATLRRVGTNSTESRVVTRGQPLCHARTNVTTTCALCHAHLHTHCLTSRRGVGDVSVSHLLLPLAARVLWQGGHHHHHRRRRRRGCPLQSVSYPRCAKLHTHTHIRVRGERDGSELRVMYTLWGWGQPTASLFGRCDATGYALFPRSCK